MIKKDKAMAACSTNAQMSAAALEDAVETIEEAGMELLKEASEKLGLSARGFHRTLRVALTLADLTGADRICRPHVAEALSYRNERVRHNSGAPKLAEI